MKKQLLCAALFLVCGNAFANDLRFTYIDGGFSFLEQDDVYIDDTGGNSTDVEGALLRVRGNIGFGNYFYIPASLESKAIEYKGRYCVNSGCYRTETSVTEVVLTAGAGVHFDLGNKFAIYLDASLANAKHVHDDDGGFDDEDYEHSDNGHQHRFGFRFAPISFLEFDVSRMRRKLDEIDIGIDTVSAQFNITQSIGVGADWRTEEYRDAPDFEKLNFVGAYFRYSFK